MKRIFANRSKTFLLLAVFGLAVRIGFVLFAGGSQITFHSGGSDAPEYVALGQNLLSGNGFGYGHRPTAFRAPGYPLLLAGFMAVFGERYILAVRLLQLLLGISTVGFCSSAAYRLFGRRAAEATFIFGLFLPTLIFPTAQILTECLAAFLTAVYLYYVVVQHERSDLRSAAGLGLSAGIGSLVRFNEVVLVLFAGWTILQGPGQKARLSRLAIVLLVPLLVVTPWLVRNEIVFHGRVLFSTQSGPNAVQGVIAPEGRTQGTDIERVHAAIPWWTGSWETSPGMSEADINSRSLRAVPGLWVRQGWHVIPLLTRKVADFWLSTDQLVDTGSFPVRERIVRAGGVLAYWLVLAFAGCGWFVLRKAQPGIAYVLLVYAAGLTALHLPLVMNTRLRIPLMDPLVVVLSGAGWVWVATRGSKDRNLAASKVQAEPENRLK